MIKKIQLIIKSIIILSIFIWIIIINNWLHWSDPIQEDRGIRGICRLVGDSFNTVDFWFKGDHVITGGKT